MIVNVGTVITAITVKMNENANKTLMNLNSNIHKYAANKTFIAAVSAQRTNISANTDIFLMT